MPHIHLGALGTPTLWYIPFGGRTVVDFQTDHRGCVGPTWFSLNPQHTAEGLLYRESWNPASLSRVQDG